LSVVVDSFSHVGCTVGKMEVEGFHSPIFSLVEAHSARFVRATRSALSLH